MSNITRIALVIGILGLLGSHAAQRAARLDDAQAREKIKAREGRESMIEKLVISLEERPAARGRWWTRASDKRASLLNELVWARHGWGDPWEIGGRAFVTRECVEAADATFMHTGREPFWCMPNSQFGRFSLLCENGFESARLPVGRGWGWRLTEPNYGSVGVMQSSGGTAPWYAGDGPVSVGNRIRGLSA